MMKLIIALAVCLNFPGIPNGNRADYGTYENLCRMDMIHTPLTPIELGEALREGHCQKFGEYPDDKRLAVGWAQVALENGQGHYTYNYNLGKIKAPKTHLHYVQRHRFRAHGNAVAGARDYWDVVSWLCRRSLPSFDAGQPEHAAHVLYGCGYYGADKTMYGQAMRQLYQTALHSVLPKLSAIQTCRQD